LNWPIPPGASHHRKAASFYKILCYHLFVAYCTQTHRMPNLAKSILLSLCGALRPSTRFAALMLLHVLPGCPIRATAQTALNWQPAVSASSDEFVGPFSSWTNVKTANGAVGDGVADDTNAIRNALNAVGTSGHSPVLYFPAGTYRITATLNLAHAVDISLIGQDPSSTSIVWNGAAGGTMLYVNGVAYSKFSRLTFNGSSTALIAVDQSKADGTSNYFDTGNEYSDDYFTQVGYGIRGGAFGYGFAETSVERSHFIGNWVAGIALMNFNALDLWVWYSTFQDCRMGVTNQVPGIGGAGNYHVYYSNFTGSTLADLVIGNTGGFSMRGNYSSGSNYFLGNTNGATNNPANIAIVGNTILDPANAQGIAILVENQGPGLVMDNIVRTPASSKGPAVSWNTFSNDQDVESIGNTFTANSPINTSHGELIETGDQVVPFASLNPVEPALPGTLPNLNRKVFEVATGSSASAIQSVIDLAFAQNGNRPVVHIPYGTYSIDRTIVVQPSDIQMVGDGYGVGSGGTVLGWTGSGAGPVLRMDGPSKVTLRDIGIRGTADGILVDNIDQASSRVYMDQAQLGSGTQSSLLVNGIDNSTVQLENMGIGGLVKVIGGPLSSSGATTPGNVDFFSGSGGSSNGATMFDVSQGGKLLVRDWWDDAGSGNSSTTFAAIHGRAQFTADGDELYQSGAGTPNFNVSSLNGTAAILTSDLGSSSGVSVSGDGGNSAVLGIGILSRTTSAHFTDTAAPSGTVAMLNVRAPMTVKGDTTGTVANVGSGSPSFITAMLAQARGQNPAVLSSLPPGVSDVRFFRVAVNGRNDVILQGPLMLAQPAGRADLSH